MAEDIRVDLSFAQPGAFAVVRGAIPWGLTRKLGDAHERSAADFADLALTHMVKSWNVKGETGEALPRPLEANPADLEWIDTRIVSAISKAAGDVLRELNAPPNGEAASSTS